jgi:peptide/nickel transport system substrate-binding protein
MEKNLIGKLISIGICGGLVLAGCTSVPIVSDTTTDYKPMAIKADNCDYGGEIKSVEAVDQYTVRFTLCRPDATFPAKIAAPVFSIQDKDFLDEKGGDSAKLSEIPNGTGPYLMKDWSVNYALTLAPSPTYWGVPPIPSRIEIRWQPSTNNRFSDYDFSSVEGIDFPAIRMTKPFSLIHYIYLNKDLQLISHDALNLYYLGFNQSIKPFDNVEVRKAIATALDRQTLINDTFPSGTELAEQIVPSTVLPGRSLRMKWYEFQPSVASTTLFATKFDPSQEITLAFVDSPMQSLYSPSALAEEIKTQLDSIGMKITLKSMPQEEFEASIKDGKEMMFLYWFMVDYADAASFFEKPFVAQQNFFGAPYSDLQSLLLQAQAITDPTKLQGIYDQMNTMVKDLVPLVPIGHATNLSIFSSKIKNVAANAFYENLEEMTVDKGNIRYVGAMQPQSLWPSDEDNYSTFRFTRLMYDTLLAPGFGGNKFSPLLAENWSSNSDLTEWTFQLRYNTKFTNGADLDANDVVASFAAIWDASSPNHVGRTGEFAFFHRLFGNCVNEK